MKHPIEDKEVTTLAVIVIMLIIGQAVLITATGLRELAFILITQFLMRQTLGTFYNYQPLVNCLMPHRQCLLTMDPRSLLVETKGINSTLVMRSLGRLRIRMPSFPTRYFID